jgi:hypothetical protein
MEMIINVLKTASAIFVTMAVWFLWMKYVRRASGCQRDQDVLEHMAHGCAGCQGDGACRQPKAKEDHREPA